MNIEILGLVVQTQIGQPHLLSLNQVPSTTSAYDAPKIANVSSGQQIIQFFI